jgi:general stress protein CsbA
MMTMIYTDVLKEINIYGMYDSKMVVHLNGRINSVDVYMPFVDVENLKEFVSVNKYIDTVKVATLIVQSIQKVYWEQVYQTWCDISLTMKGIKIKRYQFPFLWANFNEVDVDTVEFIKRVSSSLSTHTYTPIVFQPVGVRNFNNIDDIISVDTEFTLVEGSKSSTRASCPKLCGVCQNCIRGIKMQIFGSFP